MNRNLEDPDRYTRSRMMESLKNWDPKRPRRWLAKYGVLANLMHRGTEVRRYQQCLKAAEALIKLKNDRL